MNSNVAFTLFALIWWQCIQTFAQWHLNLLHFHFEKNHFKGVTSERACNAKGASHISLLCVFLFSFKFLFIFIFLFFFLLFIFHTFSQFAERDLFVQRKSHIIHIRTCTLYWMKQYIWDVKSTKSKWSVAFPTWQQHCSYGWTNLFLRFNFQYFSEALF